LTVESPPERELHADRDFRAAHLVLGVALRKEQRRAEAELAHELDAAYAWTERQVEAIDEADWDGHGRHWIPDLDAIMASGDAADGEWRQARRRWGDCAAGDVIVEWPGEDCPLGRVWNRFRRVLGTWNEGEDGYCWPAARDSPLPSGAHLGHTSS